FLSHGFALFRLMSMPAASVCRGLEERTAFHEIVKPENRPAVMTTLVAAGEIAVATHDRRRAFLDEFIVDETAKAEHFLDHQPGRDFPVVHGNYPRRSLERR